MTTVLRTISRNLSIRKTGPLGFPWHVTCFDCPRSTERTHFVPRVGAVVVNDRGVGNRTFTAALGAATEHLRAHAAGIFS